MNIKNQILLAIAVVILLIIIFNWDYLTSKIKLGRGGVIGKPGFIAESGCQDGERCCADEDGDYVCVRGWWTYKYFHD